MKHRVCVPETEADSVTYLGLSLTALENVSKGR